tara:strand:+ start:36560 stop:37126 length:567 start_codon:yes stop_codon:yes gene_type:complete
MKLWDIIKNLGSAAIQTALPGTGTLIVEGVNAFLGDADKLPLSATGDEISEAINKLPPEQQAEVLTKEYDVKIEQIKQSHKSLQTMLEADAKNKQSTRPKIAYQAWQVIGFVTLLFSFGWFYSVVTGDADMLKVIKDSYMFVGFLLAPLILWVNAYFGVLRDEAKDRLNSAQGHKVDPVTGLIGKLFK